MAVVTPVLRRSHTKSKNGCKTCRMRRIKCDEFQPRCRNCLFAQRNCEYPNAHAGGDQAVMQAFTWPEFVELSCRRWRESGEPPFPFLQLPPSPDWHKLPMKQLRYLHHLSIAASILKISETSQCCTWWSEFSLFVQLSLQYDFVACAVLAHSAERLATSTKSVQALEDFTSFRKSAMQGLRKALTEFSKENADAVLCASLCLSDQECDWRAWKALIEGISAVVSQMQPWIADSAFSNFLHPSHSSSLVFGTTWEAPNHTTHSRMKILKQHLAEGVGSLNRLSTCPKNDPSLSAAVRQLRDVVRIVHESPDDWSANDQFKLLHPFVGGNHNNHVSVVSISEGDPVNLSVLAHLCAVVVTLDLIFSAVDIPLVTPVRIKSIIGIDSILRKNPSFFCPSCRVIHSHSDLMDFPLNTVALYWQLHQRKAGYKSEPRDED